MAYLNLASIEFNPVGKLYDFLVGDQSVLIGDHVVVETDRGLSIAKVVKLKYENDQNLKERKLKTIIRRASEKDINISKKLSAENAFEFTHKKINELNLNMKLLKVEVQFGGNKVMIYFSAPGRVDFRELVKQLASTLKARVELKQVGARDEAKLLGGMGRCGREYCCSTFLREFLPVSIRMAKMQNLALNPTKVSGGCGRLLCCLTYENPVYIELRRGLPTRGSRVRVLSEDSVGEVIKVDILNQLVQVASDKGGLLNVRSQDLEVISSALEDEETQLEGEWGDDINLEALEDKNK